MRSALFCAGLSAIVAATLAVAGCGQKGPLYLPEKRGAVVTAPATTPPTPPPPPAAPAQPAQPSPAPQPQSTGEPSPSDVAPPQKKSDKDKDEDQQTPH